MRLITNKSKNLLYCISVEGNVTVQFGTSYAVATQRTADSASVNTFKLYGWDGTKYTRLAGAHIAIGKLTTTFTTPSTTGFKLIRFGLSGASIDTLCRCEMDLKPSTTYTFTCNFTNITQGSISWKDMMLVEGDTVGEYEPYSYNLLNKWKFDTSNSNYINNGDGSITTTGTTFSYQRLFMDFDSEESSSISKENSIAYLTYGHKLLIDDNCNSTGTNQSNAAGCIWQINSRSDYAGSSHGGKGEIFTNNKLALADLKWSYFYITNNSGETVTCAPALYDLTLMYGAGNEPTTVEQFYTDHPELKVSPLGFISLKNLEINNKNIKRLKYKTSSGNVDLGIIPSNSGYILDKYNNLSEELLEENIEKDNINYHIPDKTNILLNKVEGNTKKIVQLLDKSKYGVSWNHGGINWTPYVAYGTIHCVGKNTDTQYNSFHLNNSWNMDDIVFDDHKYILLTGLKQTYPSFEAGWFCGYSDEDGTTGYEWYSSTGIDQTNLNVFTIKKHNYIWKRIELRVVYGNEDTLDVWWTPQLFDLTAMYGRGNEPTTLSQFKQDYPDFFGNVYKGVFPTTISQLSLSNENILNLKDAFGDKSSSLLTTFQGKRCIKFDKNHNISYNTFLPSLTNYSLQFNVYNTGYSASFCGLFVTDKYTNVDSTVRRYCSTQTYNQWVTLKYENVNFNAIGWYQYITSDEEIYIDIDSWCLSVGSSSKDIVYKDDKIDLLNNYELNAIKNPSDGKLYQDYLEAIDNNNGTYTLKKIQYIQKLVLDGNINWTQSGTNTSGKYRFAYEINAISGSSVNTSGPIYCNKIKYPSDGEGSSYGCVESCSCGTYLYFYDNEHNTLPSDFKSYVKSLYDSGDPIIVWYAVETPTETIISSDLTYNQVSALRTNNGCLKVIGNDNDLLVQPNVVIKENFMYKMSV